MWKSKTISLKISFVLYLGIFKHTGFHFIQIEKFNIITANLNHDAQVVFFSLSPLEIFLFSPFPDCILQKGNVLHNPHLRSENVHSPFSKVEYVHKLFALLLYWISASFLAFNTYYLFNWLPMLVWTPECLFVSYFSAWIKQSNITFFGNDLSIFFPDLVIDNSWISVVPLQHTVIRFYVLFCFSFLIILENF